MKTTNSRAAAATFCFRIDLPPDLHESLKSAANDDGVTKRHITIEALTTHLDKRAKRLAKREAA